jgi:hypothetical protein
MKENDMAHDNHAGNSAGSAVRRGEPDTANVRGWARLGYKVVIGLVILGVIWWFIPEDALHSDKKPEASAGGTGTYASTPVTLQPAVGGVPLPIGCPDVGSTSVACHVKSKIHVGIGGDVRGEHICLDPTIESGAYARVELTTSDSVTPVAFDPAKPVTNLTGFNLWLVNEGDITYWAQHDPCPKDGERAGSPTAKSHGT